MPFVLRCLPFPSLPFPPLLFSSLFISPPPSLTVSATLSPAAWWLGRRVDICQFAGSRVSLLCSLSLSLFLSLSLSISLSLSLSQSLSLNLSQSLSGWVVGGSGGGGGQHWLRPLCHRCVARRMPSLAASRTCRHALALISLCGARRPRQCRIFCVSRTAWHSMACCCHVDVTVCACVRVCL